MAEVAGLVIMVPEPEVNKIQSKMLKVLDNVGLSRLTYLFVTAWRMEIISVKWKTSMIVSIKTRQGPESRFQPVQDHTPKSL